MKGGSEMKNKKWGIYRIFVCIVLSVFVVLFATMGIAGEDACFYCGMKKAMFGHSWMDIERMDGSVVGVCSVHCAAIDMALHIDQPPKNIHVGDFNSKKQIDAEKAYWIIGGDKMGVMTSRAKWAFENKASADNFMKEHGGRPAIFEEVMKAAFEDMYEDTLMIQKKRNMMRMKKAQP